MGITGWVLDRAKSLTSFVKQRHALPDRFQSRHKSLKGPGYRRRALSMLVATRWYSCEACFRSVVDKRSVIAATFADKELPENIRGVNYWKKRKTSLGCKVLAASVAGPKRDETN